MAPSAEEFPNEHPGTEDDASPVASSDRAPPEKLGEAPPLRWRFRRGNRKAQPAPQHQEPRAQSARDGESHQEGPEVEVNASALSVNAVADSVNAAARAQRIDRALIDRFPGRPVLIGQAPSATSEGWPAFFGGTSGKFLAELAEMTWFDLVRRTERLDLIERYPGRDSKGDLFPMAEAHEKALELTLSGRLAGRDVLFVGMKVAKAFV
jgi:hypothetical protein